ncbi:MAG: aldehyde:ferredoxin oxidoreductase [Spirochaetes bacterium]|nr:aldehyde ferredoxin oxidoreductase family protein [Deltaproteobacteria bacterium]RKY03829.1 MAG: aldehyde:ferredoxin oxidoreductase [Spirochaetota bacterium]
MKGFFEKILFIDLSKRSSEIRSLNPNIYSLYLGGKGIGTYLLFKENQPKIDPLSPLNSIIFTHGPATDTGLLGSSRYGVYTKSPQTGIYSESYSGGDVSIPLSRTGFDAIVIKGALDKPGFLEITDKGVNFFDAKDIWGLEIYEAEDKLLKRVGKKGAQAIVIGPAGERLIKFSVIANNYWRSAGRTGVGAVLGSKKLKGIVFHGEKRREIYDPKRIKEINEIIIENGKDDPRIEGYQKMGTSILVSIMNELGGFPTKYWSKGTLNGWENVSGESLIERCEISSRSCPDCFLSCSKQSTVKYGRHAGLTVGGPEYETIYAFGGLCMITSIEEIIYLNDLCDRLGMDTISAGNLVAFAIEATKRKKISFKIEYGDVDAIAKLLEMIAKKEGIGEILANGIIYASKKWDLQNLAIHVKGLEPAGYEPRILKGMGLAYATSDRGACHLRSSFYTKEISGEVDPSMINGKAKLLVEQEDRLTLFDALILCRFYKDLIGWEEIIEIVHALIGTRYDQNGLRKIAARITDLARHYNLREGVTKADDTLPRRLLSETLGDKKRGITKKELNLMLKQYYQMRGWSKDGIPPMPAI